MYSIIDYYLYLLIRDQREIQHGFFCWTQHISLIYGQPLEMNILLTINSS